MPLIFIPMAGLIFIKSRLLLDKQVEAPVSMHIGLPSMGQKSMDLVLLGSAD